MVVVCRGQTPVTENNCIETPRSEIDFRGAASGETTQTQEHMLIDIIQDDAVNRSGDPQSL